MEEKGYFDSDTFKESRKLKLEEFMKSRANNISTRNISPEGGASLTCKETCPSLLSDVMPLECLASPVRLEKRKENRAVI